MKFAIVTMTGVAVVLFAGTLLPSRSALSQGIPNSPPVEADVAWRALPDAGYTSAGRFDPELSKIVDSEVALERETAALVKAYAGTENEEKRAKFKAKRRVAGGNNSTCNRNAATWS